MTERKRPVPHGPKEAPTCDPPQQRKKGVVFKPKQTVVLIRHGEKAWKEDSPASAQLGPRHDAPVVESEHERLPEVGAEIVKLKGRPDVILTSPFLRTRETAFLLRDGVKDGDDIPILTTDYLGEYLGYRPSSEKVELDEETGSPKRDYNYAQLDSRLDHAYGMITEDYAESPVVWVVSHRIPLQRLMKRFEVRPCNLKDGGYVIGEVMEK